MRKLMRCMLDLVLEIVVLVVGLDNLQVVSLLGVLPLVLNTVMGGVVALSWREGTLHGFPFMVSVLLQLERVGFLLTVYFGTPSMFITLWFGFAYGTNPPLGTLIV
jgi:hypothetical protein